MFERNIFLDRVGVMWPLIHFGRPRHLGFEKFNTWKTPFLINIVLQRAENMEGTVGDSALVKRKKTVTERLAGAKWATLNCTECPFMSKNADFDL